METQNITLSLPKEVLTKVKLIAVRRSTSVTGLMTALLEDLVRQEHEYERARRRHASWLRESADLGTGGMPPATREELHERD